MLLIGAILVLICHEQIIELAIRDGLEKVGSWILMGVEIMYMLETSWFLSLAVKAIRSQEYDDFGDEIIPLVSPRTAGILVSYDTIMDLERGLAGF